MWPVEAAPGSWHSWRDGSAAFQLTFHVLPACGPRVQLLLVLFSTAPGIVLTPGSVLLGNTSSQGERPARPIVFLFSAGVVGP